ncbi:MAG: peptidylprolyl isomerase [Mariniblastus sp.]
MNHDKYSAFVFAWILLISLTGLPFLQLGSASTIAQSNSSVGPVPDSVRKEFSLDPFYKKHIDAHGMPIVGSDKVSDAAMLETHWIVNKMVGHRPDILAAMAKNKTRMAVMAFNEYTTDVPEHSHLKSRIFWDRRARGLGATRSAPAVSCAEENVLCHPNDPYSTENICIHEFAHAIHGMGMIDVDPTFDDRLKSAHESAKTAGRWKDTYAITNRQEYWAEATQSWFDDNRANDALHNDINTRAKLKKYDPAVARLCEQVYGDRDWRYKKPMKREASERAHLANVDFDNLPKFDWRKESLGKAPKVLIQTTMGDIEVELDAEHAPKTAQNFVDYVHEGHYSTGEFFRTVTDDNQPDNKIKIAVIQGRANSAAKDKFFAPIAMERTRDTGIKHLNGTISMARDQPDSAQDEFFICVGDQPELDFGGKRNPDGQGFAAFGKVTKGMEVIKKIHAAKSTGQMIDQPIKIQRAIRLN